MSTPTTRTPGTGRILRRAVHPTLLLTVAVPALAYDVLHRQGLSDTAALAVASAFPLVAILLTAVRARRLEWIGALSLAAILAGLAGGLAFHDPHILLVKDSFVSAALGLTFLASLVAPRPLIYVLSRQIRTDPAARARLDQQWRNRTVRAGYRRMTAVWGVALLTEAALRVLLSFALSPAAVLAVSPLLAAAVFGPLALWTLRRRPAGR